MRFIWCCALIGVWACPELLNAATPEEVAALRQQVDALAQELTDTRLQTRDDLTALRGEKAELDRQLRLERVRRDTLEALELEAKSAVAQLDASLEAELEPARQALIQARSYLKRSLPFQTESREKELNRMAADIEAGDPARAMTRLWRFVEQEYAMGGEVELSQQAVTFKGKRQLADVARIGMALLYYRFRDGQLAHARYENHEWQVEGLKSAEGLASVRQVFESLEENRRLGQFDLLLPRAKDAR